MVVGSTIRLDTRELTRAQWRALFHALTFVDADGNEVMAFDHRDEEVILPRGAFDLIPEVEEVIDETSLPKMPKLAYVKELDTHGFTGQKDAVRAMFKYQQGQMRMPTAFGKTSVGCAFIAACGTRTLVVVHTKDLMRQWVDRAREEIPGIDVGTIQGDNSKVGHLTVATVQTIRDRYLGKGDKFWRQFGALIIDEHHHAASQSYEWLLNVCPAYYRFGFSASSKRSDGRYKLVRFNVGPVIYKVPFKSQVEVEVQPIFTNFRSHYNAAQWTKVVRELVNDEERNKLIASVVEREVLADNSVAVLSRQIKHLHLIAEQFTEEMDGRYAVITGHLSGRKREEMLDAMRDGSLACVLATQLLEEGVDIPRLNRIALAFPGTDITVLQKVGRVSRRFEGKKLSICYDFVDPHVAVLARQYGQRKSWYKQSKIKIHHAIDERRAKNAKKEDGKRSAWRVRRSSRVG